ncbi:MAG: Flp family type IVb pilin [Acetobacteraceae bacterium]|nr:Flp family type IVb pilin [Acetobacteraceae bacterium]
MGFAGFDHIGRLVPRLRSAAGALGKDRRGVTALEYGLIAALIAVAIIGGVTSLGGQLNTAFNNIATAIGSQVGGGTGGGTP